MFWIPADILLPAQNHTFFGFFRSEWIGFSHDVVLKLYVNKDRELESAVEELFNTGFAKCHAQRITEQRSGEPDLLLLFDNGLRYTVQITAKESNTKYVDSQKAGDVIPQSASYDANGFVCIGRPDFETLAREQAGRLGQKYNYKQMPIFVLTELFVLNKEGRISSEDVEKFILNERGYISRDRIQTPAGNA
jgi:helicase